MTKNRHWEILLIFSFFFFSCEYELDKTNYIQQKDINTEKIEFNLKNSQNASGDYIVPYHFIKYEVQTFDNELDYIVAELYKKNESEIYMLLSVLDDHIYLPPYVKDGEYVLKCRVQYQSSKINLANSLLDNWSYKTFEWNITKETRELPRLNLKYDRLENDEVRLTWDKPDPDYGKVKMYYVTYQDENWWEIQVGTSNLFYEITLPYQDWSTSVHLVAIFEENYIDYLSDSVTIYNN